MKNEKKRHNWQEVSTEVAINHTQLRYFSVCSVFDGSHHVDLISASSFPIPTKWLALEACWLKIFLKTSKGHETRKTFNFCHWLRSSCVSFQGSVW